MNQEQEQRARREFAQTVSEFFNPRLFCGASIPKNELGIELAIQWLVTEGKDGTIQILRNRIGTVLENRTTTKGRLNWDEVDTLCFQALSLYLKLTDESGLGWVERDKTILAYFTELFWQLPDRAVEAREEKTNCTDYMVNVPCMLKSKELVFSWVTKRWNLDLNCYEPSRPNAHATFNFICEVFKQDGRKTHPDNIKVFASFAPHIFMDDKRMLMREDKELFVRILKQHCVNAKLEQIRSWTRDDIPKEVLEVFQDVLFRSDDRSIVLQLLRGEPVMA